MSTRQNTLEAVFRAIQTRAARGQADDGSPYTTIKSLATQNLQNTPIPDFVSSDLFKSVTKDLTELCLLVAEEYNEHGPDHDLECEERRTFDPWLQNGFLPLFADQLTSLQLSFNEFWGVAPGYFDGMGLLFPNLKTLTLANLVIGHHDQCDWVLAQRNLETLTLDSCVIVSYLSFLHENFQDKSQLDRWGIKTHDWERHPEGTWETVFDAIRNGLPNLVDFRMDNPRWTSGSHFSAAGHVGRKLTCLRYTTLDTGLLPSPWINANECTGDTESGYYDVSVPKEERPVLNRAKKTLAGDKRAFDDLVKSIERRRSGRGLHQLSF
ncbi:hypothetical protein OQA88_7066 [Cercophora sp. LCS_1]